MTIFGVTSIPRTTQKWKLVEQHFPYMLNDVVYVDGRFLARGITKNVQDDDGRATGTVILTH